MGPSRSHPIDFFMGWDGMRFLSSGMGWDEISPLGWDGMGRDFFKSGMGWYGMGRDF